MYARDSVQSFTIFALHRTGATRTARPYAYSYAHVAAYGLGPYEDEDDLRQQAAQHEERVVQVHGPARTPGGWTPQRRRLRSRLCRV